MHEVQDMLKGEGNTDESIVKIMEWAEAQGYAKFVYNCEKKTHPNLAKIKKPYSFIKAAKIVLALRRGETPYIGMAVGYDAKCSGPQLGGFMAGDQAMLHACGVALGKVLEDAYHRAIDELKKNKFTKECSRDLIKTPFMGVFYGQGASAFSYVHEDCDAELFELVQSYSGNITQLQADRIMKKWDLKGEKYDNERVVTMAKAEIFRKTIEKSFGSALKQIRDFVSGYATVQRG